MLGSPPSVAGWQPAREGGEVLLLVTMMGWRKGRLRQNEGPWGEESDCSDRRSEISEMAVLDIIESYHEIYAALDEVQVICSWHFL